MAKYNGTFSCGHEGTVNVIGPHKDREWKIEKKFSEMCPECFEKYLEREKERKNKEADIKTKEMELPGLEGTEKQIVWANTIRVAIIEKFNNYIDKLKEKYNEIEDKTKADKRIRVYLKTDIENSKYKTIEDVERAIDFIIENKIKASFFINNRSSYVQTMLELVQDEALKTEEDLIEERKEKEIILMGSVRAINEKSNELADIRVCENNISVFYKKDNDFIGVVKDLGYKWSNGCWNKKITELTGSIKDRAAELGNKLLNKGISISILDEEIRNNAIKGIYEVECDRWVKVHPLGKKLILKWYEYNSDLYNASKKLPTSKWENSSMVIDITRYNEVIEFAEMYGFKFTKKAQGLIDNYINEYEKLEVVEPVKVKEKLKKDGLNDILNSSRDVLSDLVEEE